MLARRLVRQSLLGDGESLREGGSIAWEPFLSRNGRHTGARSPVPSVPSPNRNPNLTLNLYCLYTLPLSPIHPIAVPGGILKRFALFQFFQPYFQMFPSRPITPNPLRQSHLQQNRTAPPLAKLLNY